MTNTTVVLCLALGASVAIAASVPNLVPNGGFEVADPADASRPLGFTPGHVAPSKANAVMTWEPGGLRSSRCLAIETTDSSGNGYWEATVPVTPQTPYTIVLSYKCRDAGASRATTGDPVYNTARPGGPNLELGVGVTDPSYKAPGKPTPWTDIGLAVGPVGGSYLPVATEWTAYRQTVTTRPEQTQLRVRLRLYCYAQKVWFDELTIVGGELPGEPTVRAGWRDVATPPAAPGATPIVGPTRSELRDGVLYVNGRALFPIGLYAYCCTPTDGRFSEDALAEATANGYNMLLNTSLQSPADTVADLDILAQHGMYTLLNLSLDLKGCIDPAAAREAILVTGQGRWREHPAVIGYWADDPENLENTSDGPIPPTTMAALNHARRVLQESSPRLPVVFAVSNLPRMAPVAPLADVMLSYRYPVPMYHPQMLDGWTIAYALSVIGDRPLWFNSQGFDLGCGAALRSDGFRPTPEEMRAMALFSVIKGARGWTLYAVNLTRDKQPAQWAEAMRLGRELRALAPVLAEGKLSRVAALRPGPLTGSVYYRELEHQGTHTLLAVNMSGGPIEVTWELSRPVQAQALFENRAMPQAAAAVPETFGPWEAHIYRW